MLSILAIIGGYLFSIGLGGYYADTLFCASKHECHKDLCLMAFGLGLLFGSLFLIFLQ